MLGEAKRKRSHLSIAWIDYKKAYDMVPHSWIQFGCRECFWTVGAEYGKLENGFDGKWSGAWGGYHQTRNILRRLIVSPSLHHGNDTFEYTPVEGKNGILFWP